MLMAVYHAPLLQSTFAYLFMQIHYTILVCYYGMFLTHRLTKLLWVLCTYCFRFVVTLCILLWHLNNVSDIFYFFKISIRKERVRQTWKIFTNAGRFHRSLRVLSVSLAFYCFDHSTAWASVHKPRKKFAVAWIFKYSFAPDDIFFFFFKLLVQLSAGEISHQTTTTTTTTNNKQQQQQQQRDSGSCNHGCI